MNALEESVDRAARTASLLLRLTQQHCETIEESLAAAEILFELGKRALPPEIVAASHKIAWQHLSKEIGT